MKMERSRKACLQEDTVEGLWDLLDISFLNLQNLKSKLIGSLSQTVKPVASCDILFTS